MSTPTLAEASKLINNDLVSGIAEDILTIDPMYEVMPWTPYSGQALLVNREDALGDAQFLAVGGTITAKAPLTTDQATYSATTLVGDAEVNGLVQAQSSSAGVDQMVTEVRSKAKKIGRMIQSGIVTGGGSSPEMNSLHSMVDAGQYTPASAGQDISIDLLDMLTGLVKAKDGMVDWIMMNGSTLRKYKALIRALGGANETIVQTMTNGTTRTINLFEGIPVYQNDYITSTETANGAALTGGALTSVYAGVWDDGTRKVGLSMIHPEGMPAGISIDAIGQKETKDERIVRIKVYCNAASFNRKGIARLASINP